MNGRYVIGGEPAGLRQGIIQLASAGEVLAIHRATDGSDVRTTA